MNPKITKKCAALQKTFEKELYREEEDLAHATSYHKQLIDEIFTLFKIYCSMCGKHGKDVEPALARAILFIFWGWIEASCRTLAAIILFADKLHKVKSEEGSSDDDQPLEFLTYAEKLFLRQETEDISRNTWTPQKKSKFVSLEDALIGNPTIYARIYGAKVSIDKSHSEWKMLKKLKRLRDIGAHGNISELRSSSDSIKVTYTDLENLLKCRRWYCKQLTDLPWFAGEDARMEIKAINKLLVAGFSDKCEKIRADRYRKKIAERDTENRAP